PVWSQESDAPGGSIVPCFFYWLHGRIGYNNTHFFQDHWRAWYRCGIHDLPAVYFRIRSSAIPGQAGGTVPVGDNRGYCGRLFFQCVTAEYFPIGGLADRLASFCSR